MSAWIVSKLHIDYIVTAAARAELTTDTPDETGRMLWRECLAGVAYRYPDDKDGERPAPADFRDSDVDTYTWAEAPELSAGALNKTLGCYQYQSCEHPEWETSRAKQLTDKLRGPVASLPFDDSAPWGW